MPHLAREPKGKGPIMAAISSDRRGSIAPVILALVASLTIAPIASSVSASAPASIDPALRAAQGLTSVIVQAQPGAAGLAARAVRDAGGSVTKDLTIIDGLAATLPAGAIDSLARSTAVRTITLDRALSLMDASTPPSPPSVYRDLVGTGAAWGAGYTGDGIGIAVIDTGVADVPGLKNSLVPITDTVTGVTDDCINFSGESGCDDGYGHGTFVAGIAAGDGKGSGGNWAGIAPDADIISVKLAGADGAADVSTLLAALQWIVSHADDYNIRVINLSLGTDSPQPYLIDPLNFAVERAWNAGIVVVVAASNRGPGPATITKPADDPWVITVGAIDDRGTMDTSDDLVPDFSARGPSLSDNIAKPDLVAPGAHMVSLRAPGSAIDTNFPTVIDNHYRQGSGTSFATPAVAGAVALLLEKDPSLTPDEVKYALMASATPTPASSNPFEVGVGMLDVEGLVLATPAGEANQGLLQSDGSGSLHASRGTLLVTADDAVSTLINGLYTQQLTLWDQVDYTTTEWTGASWHGASWHGASWHGASWHGASWHGASWHGASWHGASWHEADGSQPSYGTGYLGSAIYGAWE